MSHSAAPFGQQPEPLKCTPAAELTRSRLLKVKVSGDFKPSRLGDILKEFAGQVEMQTEQPLFWSYAAGFPYSRKVTFSAKNLALHEALDQLFAGVEGAGFVVISREGDKHDGWVRLTTGGERGQEKPPPNARDEETAAENLALAKKLIAAGKSAAAKPVLEILVKRYGETKAGKEARELLEKIES